MFSPQVSSFNNYYYCIRHSGIQVFTTIFFKQFQSQLKQQLKNKKTFKKITKIIFLKLTHLKRVLLPIAILPFCPLLQHQPVLAPFHLRHLVRGRRGDERQLAGYVGGARRAAEQPAQLLAR